VEAEQLLTRGWAGELVAERSTVRAASAQIDIPGASDHTLARDPFARSSRLPRSAFEGIREALESGPVLVQTPRQGYVTTLACQSCRAAARCPTCTGALAVSAPHLPPTCRWCGEQVRAWSCAECGGRELRAPVRGDARTAEEIGRAFPAVPVRTSSGDRVLTAVGPEPAIVVATPGAEPLAEGGYRCVVLLDTSLMLARADLRTGEESLRRWLNAAALARPRGADGRVVAVGESDEPTLQALLRWDPAGFARRELAERTSAHLPPVARLATVTGEPPAVESALAMLELPTWAEVLGPVPVEPEAWRGPRAVPAVDSPEPVRAVVRVPRSSGALLSRALLRMQGLRSARKLPAVRVQVDPVSLG
jgi:primosomal protein N' (replication factor Y)